MNRRQMLALTAAGSGTVALGGLGSLLAADRPQAFAFIPSDEKSHSIEKRLSRSLDDLSVTVFGRARDLERSVKRESPGAVVAPEPTLRDFGLSPSMRGVRNGSTTEPYVLITVGSPADPKSMEGETVGILGIMGRDSMERHCGELLGTGKQRIKTVTKYADLLPLLQFRLAQGVVLPSRLASALTSRSEMDLVQNKIPGGRVGLTAVSVRSDRSGARIESELRSLSRSERAVLGVEDWR